MYIVTCLKLVYLFIHVQGSAGASVLIIYDCRCGGFRTYKRLNVSGTSLEVITYSSSIQSRCVLCFQGWLWFPPLTMYYGNKSTSFCSTISSYNLVPFVAAADQSPAELEALNQALLELLDGIQVITLTMPLKLVHMLLTSIQWWWTVHYVSTPYPYCKVTFYQCSLILSWGAVEVSGSYSTLSLPCHAWKPILCVSR